MTLASSRPFSDMAAVAQPSAPALRSYGELGSGTGSERPEDTAALCRAGGFAGLAVGDAMRWQGQRSGAGQASAAGGRALGAVRHGQLECAHRDGFEGSGRTVLVSGVSRRRGVVADDDVAGERIWLYLFWGGILDLAPGGAMDGGAKGPLTVRDGTWASAKPILGPNFDGRSIPRAAPALGFSVWMWVQLKAARAIQFGSAQAKLRTGRRRGTRLRCWCWGEAQFGGHELDGFSRTWTGTGEGILGRGITRSDFLAGRPTRRSGGASFNCCDSR